MKKIFYVLSALVLFSCHKYEDGPFLTVYSAKKRLCNCWTISAVFTNGKEATSNFKDAYRDYTITIHPDNSYCINFTLKNGMAQEECGTWTLSDDKTIVIFKKSNYNFGVMNWRILKLRESEFWAKYRDGNWNETEFRLAPQ